MSGYDDDFEDGIDEASDGGRFFDLIAAESGDEQEEFYGDHQPRRRPRSRWNDGGDESFDLFTRLPAELQQIIWEFFCPDLIAKARVFNLTMMTLPRTGRGCFWESATLDQQTAPARALLGVDRQRRAMALRSFPDTLPIRRHGEVLRFNRARDVIYVDRPGMPIPNLWPEGCDRIVNLALDFQYFREDIVDISEILMEEFLRLKALYVVREDGDVHKDEALMWCSADEAHKYYVKTVEEEPGVGEDLEFMYCWPDLERHRGFALEEVNPRELLIDQDALRRCVEDLFVAEEYTNEEVQRIYSLEVWPMIRFAFGSGLDHFDKLATARLAGSGGSPDGSSEGESEEDEYESSGIDDAEIDEDEGASEAEDDLVVVSLSDDDDDDDESDADSEGPSAQFEGLGDAAAAGGLAPAQFSSAEPESEPENGVALGTADSDAESDEAPARAIKRGSRRVVTSGDEDDEEAAEPVTVKARGNVKRRARVVASDTEDSEDSASGGLVKKGESPSSDEEETQQSSESEDEAPQERMTLAERLQLHKNENPVDLEDDSDDEDGEGGYEFDKGDEDDENEEDDDSEGGHDLADEMAGESDGEGDEDDGRW